MVWQKIVLYLRKGLASIGDRREPRWLCIRLYYT